MRTPQGPRIGRPAFPTPSVFRADVLRQTSDASRREIAKVCVSFAVIARSESDEAIHSYLLFFLLPYGLLRFARNDGRRQ